MDPFTAVMNLASKALDLIGKIVDGQPPEVKKQLWEWYIEDMKAWRAFWQNSMPKKPE